MFKKAPGKAVCSIDANNKLCALPLAGHPNWHQHVPDDGDDHHRKKDDHNVYVCRDKIRQNNA